MTARWWTGRAVGFDLESDGRDPLDARIIQWAVASVMASPPPWVASEIVKPERDIPDEAAAVHGWTTEAAREQGRDREESVRRLVDALLARSGTNDAGVASPVVGHNLAFDLTILDREMRRLGIGSLGIDIGFRLDGKDHGAGAVAVRMDGRIVGTFHCIDTYVLDKLVDRYRKGSRRLEAAAEHYGVKLDGAAHDASVDCLASLRIAWRIAKICTASGVDLMARFRDRRSPSSVIAAHTSIAHWTTAELHKELALAAAEQAEGLREHFTRNPDKGDAASVSGAWPFQPYE